MDSTPSATTMPPTASAAPTAGAPAPVIVSIPTELVPRTGSRRIATAGGTVREVIAALDAQYPGLRFNLCHETGELRPFVNIFLDGKNIRYLQTLDTPVSPGAHLHILPSVAGG